MPIIQIPHQTNNKLAPATLGLRFINYIIDGIISFTVSVLVTVLVIFIAIMLKIKLDYPVYMAMAISIYEITHFLYYYIFELLFDRTFAKFLTKTQVISQASGHRSRQMLIRSFARNIPFNEFSILGSSKKTWHDSLSKTLVVKSSDLPLKQRPSKSVDKIITVIAVLLLLLPASLWIVYPAYERFTGGERIDLPIYFPADLRLHNVQEVEHVKADYYTLEYKGNERNVRITRLIAGYNYESDKDCVYMTPVNTDLFTQNSYKGMLCEAIYRDATTSPIVVYEITTSQDLLTRPINDIPHYYILDPPFVLVIRADTGTISQQEIIEMAKSGLKTYTYEELEETATR